ncbi:hypothetical protein HDV00_002964 [Rhizophlyctis rosea]|nr:hypothetical protein HDV00_002964 [Rhizophlyctis rosea]
MSVPANPSDLERNPVPTPQPEQKSEELCVQVDDHRTDENNDMDETDTLCDDPNAPLLLKPPSTNYKKVGPIEKCIVIAGISLLIITLIGSLITLGWIVVSHFEHKARDHRPPAIQNPEYSRRCDRSAQYGAVKFKTVNGTNFVVPGNSTWLWVEGSTLPGMQGRSQAFRRYAKMMHNGVEEGVGSDIVLPGLVEVEDDVVREVINWSIHNAQTQHCIYDARHFAGYFGEYQSPDLRAFRQALVDSPYNRDLVDLPTRELLKLWDAAHTFGLVPLEYLVLTSPNLAKFGHPVEYSNDHTMSYLPSLIANQIPLLQNRLANPAQHQDTSGNRDHLRRVPLRINDEAAVIKHLVHTYTYANDTFLPPTSWLTWPETTEWEQDFIRRKSVVELHSIAGSATTLGMKRLYALARLQLTELWAAEFQTLNPTSDQIAKCAIDCAAQ